MLNKRFTFLCTEDERDKLNRLARFLHRSRGDTIRELIREAVIQRGLHDAGVAHVYEKQPTTAEAKK